MARRSFEQVRASIIFNESLHKIEDGLNYGVDIEKLCHHLECQLQVKITIKDHRRSHARRGRK